MLPGFTLIKSDVTVNSNETILTAQSNEKLPGDLAMWFFILAELTVFALFFIGFAISEQQNLTMFAEGKAELHQSSGLINTIALITSSFFVALALNVMNKGQSKQASLFLVIAKLVACIYIWVKISEYLLLFEQGIDIETNTFFTLYFLITAFHLMHVLLGMVILAFINYRAIKGQYSSDNLSGFESGASYWHMVDLLWVILFPLIYVI